MEIRSNLKYTKDHEWISVDGNGKAYIGITDFAQDSLGDIVFVELPEIGDEIKTGEVLATVESVKAASDIYAPVSGTVLEVNNELIVDPEKLNEAPYDNWIAVIEIHDETELEALLDATSYEDLCNEEA